MPRLLLLVLPLALLTAPPGCVMTGLAWRPVLEAYEQGLYVAEPAGLLRAVEGPEALHLELVYSDRSLRRLRLRWDEVGGCVEEDPDPWPRAGRPLRLAARADRPAELRLDEGSLERFGPGGYTHLGLVPERERVRGRLRGQALLACLATPFAVAFDLATAPVMVPFGILMLVRDILLDREPLPK